MQLKYHMVTIEDLVPRDHFLRKLERSLDLSFVYDSLQSSCAARKIKTLSTSPTWPEAESSSQRKGSIMENSEPFPGSEVTLI